MDLLQNFANQKQSTLAEMLRPQILSEIVGQQDLVGPSSNFGQLIQRGFLPSLIIWGPPGTGKTSFARILANTFDAYFISLNATDAGVKLLRDAAEKAKENKILFQKNTIVFVDEIHRFNKGQQDVLLPYIESGDVILIGATTENPSYELNKALLSRCRVLIFKRLENKSLLHLIQRAESFFNIQLKEFFSNEIIDSIVQSADGDARRLLNSLEIIFNFINTSEVKQTLSNEELEKLLLNSPMPYDKNSELHYDMISAFIKSIRGSDPNSAVYYLARMLEGGEDPLFIARRLIVLASEDIGNADPRALSIAVSGMQALEMIGLPEGAITLSQVVTYLASCPKSNASYMALKKAKHIISKTKSLEVPIHLRSSTTEFSKSIGYGQNYLYPHDFSYGQVHQNYLPESIKDEKFYEPKLIGFEKTIIEYLNWIKSIKKENI